MVTSILDALRRIKSDVAQLLQAAAIEDICHQIGYTWRERALGPVATIHAFLLQVLHGNTACNHVPHLAGNVEAIEDSLGNRTTYTSDALGRRINSTNPLDDITTFVYDAAGRQHYVINPLGHATTFLYDANGRQEALLDAEGNRTTTVYDDAGRPEATQSALGYRA
ncbi:MAG: hypothetical protein WDZ59_07915 [Pirellulales bacterium]